MQIASKFGSKKARFYNDSKVDIYKQILRLHEDLNRSKSADNVLNFPILCLTNPGIVLNEVSSFFRDPNI